MTKHSSIFVLLALLPACDQVLGLKERPPDAAIDAPEVTTCLTDPSYRSLGTIPESRYAAGTTPGTWLAARDECRALGAHLVVATQFDAEWNALSGVGRLANSHWVGVTNFAPSSGVLESVTGEPVGTRQPPWGIDQPDGRPGEECVAFESGTLSDVACDGPYVAACECELPVTCQTSVAPRSYEVIAAATTWDGAHAACEAIGLRLAVVTDSNELETIIGTFGGGSFWIDATDRAEEGRWRTRDGCRPYLRWGTMGPRAEPNGGASENCAAIIDASSMELIDANCDAAIYSTLCETL